MRTIPTFRILAAAVALGAAVLSTGAAARGTDASEGTSEYRHHRHHARQQATRHESRRHRHHAAPRKTWRHARSHKVAPARPAKVAMVRPTVVAPTAAPNTARLGGPAIPAQRPARVSGSRAAASGMASYYWQGSRTASGARFNPDGLTAAHRTLPFGTKVRVTHAGSGRSVVVVINDRGPFVGGRVIDLSRGAARSINMTGQGVAPVRLEVLGR